MKVFAYGSLILIGTFISAISQVMLKKSSMRHYDLKIREYMNPLVITAYLMFVCTTFLSIYAYKEIPLSLGPVLEASSYVYVTIFGVTIFGEKISTKKIIALSFIIFGIIIFSFLG